MMYRHLLRPVLFALDAEGAHKAALAALKRWPAGASPAVVPNLAISAFGLNFSNPVGLAAGFDKGGEVVDALLSLGFGFVEVGTVTPLPQPGNPKPRLFRLPADNGVINRLGFNSEGHAPVARRLQARTGRGGLVGVNLGANKESGDRIDDYVRGISTFAAFADYFTINISSPNTPGLRDLQQGEALSDLLARTLEARDRAADAGKRRPVLLKIAPDLSLPELDAIVRTARARGVDGMIVSNTTIGRPSWLKEQTVAREAGGLSGRPVFELATRMLAETFVRVDGAFALVGVGGIENGETALAKIEAGASLLQVYSAIVYEGPGLPRRIVRDLSDRLKGRALSDAIGARARDLIADTKN